ncbi:centrosomal protein of 126 kDa [Nematolebias whitei]|uniref:centrosomal protein of 126 kDa n=1 Tax=Nematolebias whitei TaxID=451745 RepID=UPI001899D2DF|nr:centrosomal protein of 126 kDa [Nematolebias whitei]
MYEDKKRALDDRRKLWDTEEKRLRENILQQRRQQVQEATERFQRAHLPPPQRYRQPLTRNAPNIEDALSQIQGSLGSHAQQPSLLSTHISRGSTPSPTPPTAPRLSHRRALSAVEAYSKLLQEQCRIETLHNHNLQGSHDSDSSESLSSKDSLEDEDSNQSTSDLQCSRSLFSPDSEKTHAALQKQSELCPTSASFSAMVLLDENLALLRKLHEPQQETQEDSKWVNNGTVDAEALWDFTSIAKIPKTENHATPNNNLLALCKLPKEDPDYSEVKSLQTNHNDSVLMKNRVVLGNPDESPCSRQEALLDLRERRIHDDSHLKYPSSTDASFPSKNGSSKDILFETPLKNNMADIFTNNRTLLPTKKENFTSSRINSCASINNLNKVSNSESKTEKAINGVFLPNASLSKIQSETHKCPEEDEKSFPVSGATPHSVCKVKLVKGILKKQSKNMPGDTCCMHDSDRLIFASHVALALRDSVELTRAKSKDQEVNTVKKKLRWFDEVFTGKDHQPSLTKESRSPKPGPSMTPAASTGYHFTKEAWADVGVQVNLPQERADGVKAAHSSAKNSGSKIPQRARPSRPGGGPVCLRTRKGTAIRPQSATEVSQIAKAQGKIMAPRPPPRTEPVEEKTQHVNKTPYGMKHVGSSYKQALVIEEDLPKNHSVRIVSPKTRDVISTDRTVVYTALPRSRTCFLSGGNTKGTPISGHRDFHQNSGRGLLFREKGFCLDVTPTDEEISQLWHGVRSALNTKEDESSLERQAVEKRDQSRQPPGSANRRLLQTSQHIKQNFELLRTCSSTHNTALNEGFESAAQIQLAEGLWKENQTGGPMEIAQTLRPVTEQQRRQQQEITTISLEEKKILLSLEKLNHQLHNLQEHVGHNAGTRSLAIIDTPFTNEVTVTNYKHRATSANSVPYQKKV